ncbi:hypothetical protein NM688_g4551 [Phlebia brevispora]|uniref:Uncharacterized protein n=1 Tax=Phlebia brevispora TaxID=194682 RepID=A0ACC1T2M1_9APHY|nr:hypothetical protein NM688_g4551 [Phlebia brevispora]
MIISKGHVEIDKRKVAGVLEWPVLAKVKQVQAFLGFANFYRRFIQDFAKIAKPLTTFTKKDQPWVWSEEQQNAFKALKKAFTSALILHIPDDVNSFYLAIDASDFAIGATLSQKDSTDQLWHPVAFYSKSLNPGKTMQAEDSLSRRSDHEKEVNLNNLDQIVLKLEHFAIMAIEASHETPINDEQILKEVKEALLSDEVTKSYKSLLETRPWKFKKSLQE